MHDVTVYDYKLVIMVNILLKKAFIKISVPASICFNTVLYKSLEPPLVSLYFSRKIGNRCSYLLKDMQTGK